MTSDQLENIASQIPPIQIRAELFKKGDFDFIVKQRKDGEEFYHKKQDEALKTLTNKKTSELLFGGAANGAKAQPLDSKIYTPFGYKLMGDIKVGDVIKHPLGTNTNVIAIHPQGKKKIYEVTFLDGAKTKCCGDHLWNVHFSRKTSKQEKITGRGKIQTTEMLIDKLHRNPTIPLSKPLEFTIPINKYITPIWDKIHPYILGVLIGDGSLTKQVTFTTVDKEILDKVVSLLPNKYSITNNEINYNIVQNERNEKGYPINDMYSFIKELKLNCKSEHKFIPKEYYHASLKVRWELIKGLMDTDGTVAKKGNCSYSTSSEQLAYDFQYIVRSLGFKATKTTHKTTHLDNYIIYIQGENKKNLFNLRRKRDRCKEYLHGKSLAGRRMMSIVECGYEEAQCITVDANDGLYITDDFIVTHNTWTGCVWILFMAICYPETRYFIARNELGDLVTSVLVTFKKVARMYGFSDYKYNAVKNFIQLGNGSHINLIEIKYRPSDPMFEDLGSTEYTCGWIEEVGEIHEVGAQVISKRAGRHLNDKYNIPKTIFYTCNPKRNWAKREFYDKCKTGELESHKHYIPCLVLDNPFREKGSAEDLEDYKNTNKILYERLYKGNWDYEDNPFQLTDQEMIEVIFENNHVPEGYGYITADVARFGSDRARIGYWNGWDLRDVISLDISKTTDVELAIKTLRFKYKVPRNRVVVDDDGVGGGVTDGTGAKGFKNNGRPIRQGKGSPNYKNLQVQCLYLLAEKINEGGLCVSADLTGKEKEEIKEELSQIQSKGDQDPERKLDCKRKGEIKQDIGRSPDWRDMMLMRVFFDIKKNVMNLTTSWS